MAVKGHTVDDLVQRLQAALAARFATATLARLDSAISCCLLAHAPQQRKHGASYALHPLRVTLMLLEEFGVADPNMLCAALLHDVLEDASDRVSAEDIRATFGQKVLSLVETLTSPSEQQVPDKQERNRRKAAQVAEGSPAAQLIKLADRIDNLHDAASLDGPNGQEFRERYYEDTIRHYVPLAHQLLRPDVLATLQAALARLKECS